MIFMLCFVTMWYDAYIDSPLQEVEVQAYGKLIDESSSYYMVDFSRYAAEHQFIGDYSRVLLSTKCCVRAK